MNLNNLKIGTRLAFGFGAVLVLLLASVAMCSLRLVQIERDVDAAAEYERRANLADQWAHETQLNISRMLAVAKSAGRSDIEAFFTAQMKGTTAKIEAAQKDLEASVSDDAGKAALAAVAEKRQLYVALSAKLQEHVKQSDQVSSEALLKDKLLPAVDAYVGAMVALQQTQREQASARNTGVHSALRMSQVTLVVMLLASLLVGAGMAYAITRSVTRPLRSATDAANLIAQNDLSQSLGSHRQDELGELLRALGKMQASLGSVVAQVRASTDSISNASTEIASGNQDLSTRTEQTAANLQQAASSMEQLTGTVKQSADSARQANQLASSAAEVAQRGGVVVSQVV
ncbi:MAG TPA: HAMP domain-containing protein, partial [Albitalea sp.]|nr:HAMP domain-containing protein [Albitalea sp.]